MNHKTLTAGIAFLLVFSSLLAVALVSGIWHSIPLDNSNYQMSLENYDSKVDSGNACFLLEMSSKNTASKSEFLEISANGKLQQSAEIDLADSGRKEFCIENSALEQGDNFIKASIGQLSVFFHAEKTASLQETIPELKIEGIEKKNDSKASLKFFLKNPEGKAEKAQITVNGVLVNDSFYTDGFHEETISIGEGSNSITVFFQGISEKTSLKNQAAFKSNLIAGLLLIAAFITVLMFFVFGKKMLEESIAYSICFFLLALTFLVFALGYLGLLSGVSVILGFAAVMAVILIAFWKNFHIPPFEKPKIDLLQVFIALLLLSVIVINVFTPTNVSFWTSYYERQSKVIFEDSKIPVLDGLLNFGEKPAGYVSGYFFQSAGLSFLTGSYGEAVFAILVLLADLMLVLFAFFFFKKITNSSIKAKLAVMLILLGGFLFSDFFFTPRHSIALALCFFALLLFIDKKTLAAGIIAGAAMLVQAPIIVIIAILAFAITREKTIAVIKFSLLGAAFGVLFFLPTLLSFGIPFQAEPTVWGHFFGMPAYGVFVDLLAQMVFFIAIALPLAKFRPKFDGFAKKLLAVLLVLAAIQLSISYRVNIATIIVFSFLGVYLIPENILQKSNVKKALFAIFVLGALFAGSLLSTFYVPESALQAAEYLREKTPNSERFLTEPALGHYTALFGEKKIMSDLAVEFENQNYLDESFEFLQSGNSKILEENKIGFVFNRAHIIETQPIGSKLVEEPIEFPGLDKIFDNGEFFIFRNRQIIK